MDRTIYSVELPKRPGVEKFDTFMGMDVIAQLDGEKHDRLRRLLSQPFSPGAVQALHGAIENNVDDLIDAILAKGAPERSEASRVGTEGVSRGRLRWSPFR